MSNYKLYKEWPILYGTEKNGKTKVWKASVHYDNITTYALSLIEFGQIDGKKQVSSREYKEGKNIGKKNETSPLQQCINETEKKWIDKKEKDGYNKDNKDNKEEKNDNKDNDIKEIKYFPMLAHTYEPNTDKKKKNDIVFPCYVQPKLDGLRCIIYKKEGIIKCQSRTGTYFETMNHIIEELKTLFSKDEKLVLDGELYTNDFSFEELSGLIKKKKITDTDKEKLKNVKYHVYDIINNKIYEDRHNDIIKLINNYKYTLCVPTYKAEKDNFKSFFSTFIENGYEGIMLRNINGLYSCNFRSHDLQKYKEFKEGEYEIVGFKEGDGRDKGTVIWICKTENKEFSVRPKGSIEIRKEFFNNAKNYVGKYLTVIYQELSETCIPRFPVGKDIREDY
jgi:DNA ligase-1